MYKETVGDAPYRAHVCSDDVPDSVSISKCSRSEVSTSIRSSGII